MLIIHVPLYSKCRTFRKTSAYKTSDWIRHHILLASMPFFRVEILSAYNKTCWVFFTLKWQTEKEITSIKMTTENPLFKYQFPMERNVILHLKILHPFIQLYFILCTKFDWNQSGLQACVEQCSKKPRNKVNS